MAIAIIVFFTFSMFPSVSLAWSDTIPRPEIQQLYRESDVVAFVKIVSGESERYEDVVYKATVVLPLKGVKKDQYLFFGPYSSFGVGSEYLVFLKDSKVTIGHISKKTNPGLTVLYDETSRYFRIQYGGYSILPISFECGFGSASGLSNGCDYAVDVSNIILSKKLESSPKEFKERTDGKPFVRRLAIIDFLNKLKKE